MKTSQRGEEKHILLESVQEIRRKEACWTNHSRVRPKGGEGEGILPSPGSWKDPQEKNKEGRITPELEREEGKPL